MMGHLPLDHLFRLFTQSLFLYTHGLMFFNKLNVFFLNDLKPR